LVLTDNGLKPTTVDQFIVMYWLVLWTWFEILGTRGFASCSDMISKHKGLKSQNKNNSLPCRLMASTRWSTASSSQNFKPKVTVMSRNFVTKQNKWQHLL